jgi:acetyltransferase-like isoleucine patch superfamily enzyme
MEREEEPLGPGYFARELVRLVELLATDRRAGFGRLKRAAGVLRAAVLFRGCETGELVNAKGFVRVVPDGKIRVGDRSQFAGGMFPTELICRKGGELTLGARCIVNYGASIQATWSVRIGERCLLASRTRIRDAGGGRVSPVVIGDDVWIAYGARVEPGVTIGEGSVVAAGAVVHSDVPPFSLASGNPAVCIPLTGVPSREGGGVHHADTVQGRIGSSALYHT